MRTGLAERAGSLALLRNNPQFAPIVNATQANNFKTACLPPIWEREMPVPFFVWVILSGGHIKWNFLRWQRILLL